MKILESPLMRELIRYLKSNWGGYFRVIQRRRRLMQLVAMVRGVADAAERSEAVRGHHLNRWLDLLRDEALRGQAVLDASSNPPADRGFAKKLLTGLKALLVSSANVERLNDAVDALERLAGPGGDLDIFLKVLQLDEAAAGPLLPRRARRGRALAWTRMAATKKARRRLTAGSTWSGRSAISAGY